MAALDDSRDSKDISEKMIVRPIHLLRSSEAEESSQNAGIREDQAPRIEDKPQLDLSQTQIADTPRPEVLQADIDEQVTQAEIQAVYESQSYSIMLDGFPIDEQPTWIIPAVRDVSKAPKLAARGPG